MLSYTHTHEHLHCMHVHNSDVQAHTGNNILRIHSALSRFEINVLNKGGLMLQIL